MLSACHEKEETFTSVAAVEADAGDKKNEAESKACLLYTSLNQSENVPIRQCTAPARNIFAKQPLENAGTWQGERKQSRA